MKRNDEIPPSFSSGVPLPSIRLALLRVIVSGILVLIAYAARADEGDAGNAQLEERNKLEWFVGVTHLDIDGRTSDEFSFGAGYEYRIDELFGAGGLAEYTNGIDALALIAVVYFHPSESWRFTLGPGVEIEDGQEEFLVRVSMAYEFTYDGWTLSPEIGLDFVNSEVNEVFGINFGWLFW